MNDIIQTTCQTNGKADFIGWSKNCSGVMTSGRLDVLKIVASTST